MCRTEGGGLFIVDVEREEAKRRGDASDLVWGSREPVRALYHMRVSVPSIPDAVLRTASAGSVRITPALAADRVAQFLSKGTAAVITGAGVSVDSGIRAYRGTSGRYLNPNYKCVYHFACFT